MHTFMQLLRHSNGSTMAQQPWGLRGEDGNLFCKSSGYSSCTHWIANIPIGDETVKVYKFPGNVDGYAGSAVDSKSQITKLTPYKVDPAYPLVVRDLIQRTWTIPGQKQFVEVLGKKELSASLRGEYANPGYVATRLVGHVSRERMPVVFISLPDHRTPIDPNFDPKISAY